MSFIPLYKRIQEDIKTQIATNVLREGDRIASESEMMKHYFVSSITVKNALNGLVDEGIIYRLKGKGTFVAVSPFTAGADARPDDSASPTIGVVFPTLSTRTEQEYIIHIERICREMGARLMVGCSRELPAQEIQLVQDFIKHGISALILLPSVSEINNAAVRQLSARKFPVVFMDRQLPDAPASYVVSDNADGAAKAAEYLLQRCGGDIGMVHFPPFNQVVIERIRGFSAAFAASGRELLPTNLCPIDDSNLLNTSSEARLEQLFGAIMKYLQQNRQLRGAFAANCEIAQVLALALNRLGKTPGLDFDLVCFDNPYLPGVSFIQQDCRRMSQEAMRLLRAQMDGEFQLEQVVIPTELVRVKRCPETLQDMRYLVLELNH